MPSLPPNRAILSTQPRHSLYPTAPFPLPNPTIPSNELRFHPLTFAPFLRRDTIVSAHLRKSFSALVPSLLCTNAPTVAYLRTLFYRGSGAVVRWGRSGAPIQSNHCSHTVRAVVGGIGEKSIEYPRKVYRVSEKSL